MKAERRKPEGREAGGGDLPAEVEAQVPGVPGTVFLTPYRTREEAQHLLEAGIPRGRILTPAEIDLLREMKGLYDVRDHIPAILRVKEMFDGRIVGIRRGPRAMDRDPRDGLRQLGKRLGGPGP